MAPTCKTLLPLDNGGARQCTGLSGQKMLFSISFGNRAFQA